MWPPPSSPLYERPFIRRSRPVRSRRQLSYCSSSAVPFSWEQLPGIPKPPCPDVAPAPRPTDPLLPLPPLLRSAAKKPPVTRSTAADHDDPFAAAFAECTKDPPSHAAEEIIARSSSGSGRHRTGGAPKSTALPAGSFSDRLGLFVLQASCKGTCAIAKSAVYDPSRSGPSYNRLNRRSA